MEIDISKQIEEAKRAATDVLVHNAHGPFQGLPRTAGWGYPEPYTRDLMIAALGIAVTGNSELMKSLRRVLEKLAKNQSEHGHIPSLVHDRHDRGASDTTPLFLLAVGIFRKVTGEMDFLEEQVRKSLTWMVYQSPSDRVLVAQQPTTDWRDEQWVMGFGLYVNTIVYSYLRLLGLNERADKLQQAMDYFTVSSRVKPQHVPEGLMIRHKPYFALWSYKVYSSERFDLLGNSIAVLSGIASRSRAEEIIHWIEVHCYDMKKTGDLALDLPANLFPYIRPDDADWHPRFEEYNQPGEYHNGGIWPFVCGFYVAALVAAGRTRLAEKKLVELTKLVKVSRDESLAFGFNEWYKAQDGTPCGQDWQTWSAAMYLYAAKCVEDGATPFFEEIRG
ncbi:MAG: amylo-alpha-16-glucosidase [Bacteroides sp. SM23_62]|nr:MAG: amylo-alpha-16-glucosidase [Bacteroides sp. SM23_62]